MCLCKHVHVNIHSYTQYCYISQWKVWLSMATMSGGSPISHSYSLSFLLCFWRIFTCTPCRVFTLMLKTGWKAKRNHRTSLSEVIWMRPGTVSPEQRPAWGEGESDTTQCHITMTGSRSTYCSLADPQYWKCCSIEPLLSQYWSIKYCSTEPL